MKTSTAFCFVVMGLLGCASSPETAHTDQAVNEYPDIELILQNGEALNARELEGRNVFMFFSPECIHCHEEARAIRERLDDFRGYTIWFISSLDMGKIKEFAEMYELQDRENVRFAWSGTEGVLDFYGPIRIPSAYIYEEGKLQKSFSGPTPVDSLINAL